MASIVQRNLEDRVKNDTFSSVEFEYLDGNDDPIDLTDCTIRAQFRFRSKTGAVVKDIVTGTGITLTDPTNGIFKIDEFTPVDWEVDSYYYDVQVTFPSGKIKTYVWGIVKIIQDVTDF
jgi:hypothetical protein